MKEIQNKAKTQEKLTFLEPENNLTCYNEQMSLRFSIIENVNMLLDDNSSKAEMFKDCEDPKIDKDAGKFYPTKSCKDKYETKYLRKKIKKRPNKKRSISKNQAYNLFDKVFRVNHSVKNRTINDFVKAFTKLYDSTNKTSKVSRIFDKQIIKKDLCQIPVFSTNIRFLNPMKFVRIFNDYMPLESNVFVTQDISNLTPVKNYENVAQDNRVHRIHNDIKKNRYILEMEPIKLVDHEAIKYVINNFRYYKKWLLSQGQQKAKEIFDILVNSLNTTNDKTFLLQSMVLQTPVNKKMYIKKINNITWKYIESKPYIIRVEKSNLQSHSIPQLSSIKISKSFCDMTKLRIPQNDGYSGFRFAQLSYCLNWAELFQTYFNSLAKKHLEYDDNTLQEPDLIFDNNMNYITDIYGNIVDCHTRMFIEKYIKNDIVYSSQIYVFEKILLI